MASRFVHMTIDGLNKAAEEGYTFQVACCGHEPGTYLVMVIDEPEGDKVRRAIEERIARANADHK